MINQVYAIKQRMHQEFIGGKRVPVTVLTVPEHIVLGRKTSEKDGYEALILGLGKTRKPTTKKSLLGFLKGKDFTPEKIKEVKVKPSTEEITPEVEKALTAGSLVTVTAKSKGKGFAGVVKRWGFAGGPRTHGQSDRERAPGSIARGTTPGRVVKGKRMAGHMGNVNVSVKNLKVLSYDQQTRNLKLQGSVPGNTKSWVTIKITKIAEVK
ncbi:50S ribosomal protein L3 [Candidatus Collierbacteria bacterium]|nr:50S ribosomal protein L3 [Candidatus Collierbacteria bacterium]